MRKNIRKTMAVLLAGSMILGSGAGDYMTYNAHAAEAEVLATGSEDASAEVSAAESEVYTADESLNKAKTVVNLSESQGDDLIEPHVNTYTQNNEYMNDLTDHSYLEKTREYLNKKAKKQKKANNRKGEGEEVELPEKFDLRDYGLVSPVKNQGNTQSCYAQAISSCVETELIENNPLIEINPYQMVSSYVADPARYKLFYNDIDSELDYENPDIYYRGGYNNFCLASMAMGLSPTQMKAEDRDNPLKIYSEEENKADFSVENYGSVFDIYGRWGNEDDTSIDDIKRRVYKKKAVDIAIDASYGGRSSDYYNYATSAAYRDNYAESNHEVVIVGWDDNYSRENFVETCRPEKDGAWIVKNSWGTDSDDDGYMYLSYEDKAYLISESATIDISDNDDYEYVYSYDECGFFTGMAVKNYVKRNNSPKEGFMANIFTAEEDEQIEYVGFCTTDIQTEYSITIYTGVEGDDPIAGECVFTAQDGVTDSFGFHRIKLDKPIKITKGEDYSVVIYLKNPCYRFPIPVEFIEMKYLNEKSEKDLFGKRGESFVSYDGDKWEDVRDLGLERFDIKNNVIRQNSCWPSNVCVKAYTNPLPEDGEAVASVEFSTLGKNIPVGTKIELSAADADEIYYNIDGGDYQKYESPIEFTNDCKISAYAVKGENAGNVKEKEYHVATSGLSDLILVSEVNYFPVHLDLKAGTEFTVTGGIGKSFKIKPIGTDTIKVDGKVVNSNTISDEFTLDLDKHDITIVSEDENKKTTTYTIEYQATEYIDYDFEKGTIEFDEDKYDIYCETENVPVGMDINTYIDRATKGETIIFEVYEDGDYKNIISNEKCPVRNSLTAENIEIDYANERTRVAFPDIWQCSTNPDMTDAKTIGGQLLLTPGTDMYVQYRGSSKTRKFRGEILKIEVPDRPKLDKESFEKDILKINGNIIIVNMQDGYYYDIYEPGDEESYWIESSRNENNYTLWVNNQGTLKVVITGQSTNDSFKSEPLELSYDIKFDEELAKIRNAPITVYDENTGKMVAKFNADVNQYYSILDREELKYYMPITMYKRLEFVDGKDYVEIEFDEDGNVVDKEYALYVNVPEGYDDFSYEIRFIDIDGNLIETSEVKNDKIGILDNDYIDVPEGYEISYIDFSKENRSDYNSYVTEYNKGEIGIIKYGDIREDKGRTLANPSEDEKVELGWIPPEDYYYVIVEKSDDSDNPDDSSGSNPSSEESVKPGAATPGAVTSIDGKKTGVTTNASVSSVTSANDEYPGKKFTKGGIVYKVIAYDKSKKSGKVAILKVKKNKQKKLKKVTIKKKVNYKSISFNVKKINNKAFAKCKKLKKITFKSSSVPKLGKKAFTGVSKAAKYYVPSKSLKAYRKALKKAGAKGKVLKQ